MIKNIKIDAATRLPCFLEITRKHFSTIRKTKSLSSTILYIFYHMFSFILSFLIWFDFITLICLIFYSFFLYLFLTKHSITLEKQSFFFLLFFILFTFLLRFFQQKKKKNKIKQYFGTWFSFLFLS